MVESRNPDPIYGDAARATWEELKRRAGDAARSGIDVGACALRDFPVAATAARPQAPLLLATHLDAWTQTNPEPIVQPAVNWFLHGIDPERATRAEVSIVWRRDRSGDVLRLVPPRQAESLQLPIGAARAWLSNGAEQEVADVEAGAWGARGEVRGASAASDGSTDWVRWEGFDEQPGAIASEDIRPGDLLGVREFLLPSGARERLLRAHARPSPPAGPAAARCRRRGRPRRRGGSQVSRPA